MLLVVVGMGFYLTGYDRGFPLYESEDEIRNLNEVYALRGLTNADLWKPGYPPGILWINHGAQVAAEQFAGQPATAVPCIVVGNVRLTGIPFNLLSAVFIALIGRRLVGGAAGLIAAAAWLFNANVLAQTQFGFPQTYEHLAFVMALYFALLALETHNPRWALASTVAGLVAVLFKYTLFPVLGLGVGAALWQLRGNPRRWATVLSIQIALIVGCAAWLWFGYDATRLIESGHRETENLVEGQALTNLQNVPLILRRLGIFAQQLNLPLSVFAGVTLTGIAVYWRKATQPQRLTVFAMLGLTILYLFMLVATLDSLSEGLRQKLTVVGYAHILFALAIVALGRGLGALTGRHRTSWALTGIAAAAWLVPLVASGWEFVNYRNKPVSYAMLTEWAGTTVPNDGGTRLLVSDDRPFSSGWSCYGGPYHPAVQRGELWTRPLPEWVEDDFYFVQVDEGQMQNMARWGVDGDYYDHMTLLAEFPPKEIEDEWRTWRRGVSNHELFVFHALPIEHTTDVVFNEEIRLVGYTLTGENPLPGSSLQVWLYWQVEQAPARDYQTFMHLVPSDGETAQPLAQGDGPPTGNAFRPTSTWADYPGERLIAGGFNVALPPQLASGDYLLRVGLYDAETGARLLTQNGEDAILLPVTVGAGQVQAATP